MKLRVRICDRRSEIAHEKGSRLVMRSSQTVLPETATVRIWLRLSGLPLVIRSVPVLDVSSLVARQSQGEVECGLVHGRPKLAVVLRRYEIDVGSVPAPLICR